MEHPGYRAAYQAAQDMAEELARQLATPVTVYRGGPNPSGSFEIMTSSGTTIGLLMVVQPDGHTEKQE